MIECFRHPHTVFFANCEIIEAVVVPKHNCNLQIQSFSSKFGGDFHINFKEKTRRIDFPV